MKKLIVILIVLTAVVSITGCIETETIYKSYAKSTSIEYLEVTIPDGQSVSGVLKTDIIYPDGTEKGTYRTQITNRDVDVYVNIILSKTGSYKIIYEGNDFVLNKYMFVGSTPEKVQLSVTHSLTRDGDALINIHNGGKENAYIYLRLTCNDVVTLDKDYYNYEYAYEKITIRNGYDIDLRYDVKDSKSLTLRLNEDLYTIE